MSATLPTDLFSVPIVFCRVGWMDRYQGLAADDSISGGGDYVHQHGFGHEIMNFQPFEGHMYGFVQRASRGGSEFEATMNLAALGGSTDAESLPGVLVVWVARHPAGGTRVVGWYRNATIYRQWQPPPEGSNRLYAGSRLGYFMSAAAEDAVLIPVDERSFEVLQSGPGSFGRNNTWYANDPNLHQDFRRRLFEYVNGSGNAPAQGTPKQTDPLKRVQVEEAAITCVWDYYSSHGYELQSREEDNVGWDLEARQGQTLLRIEVKGLSGSIVCAEVTPNEYRAMIADKQSYRLCIVTSALAEPSLNVFAFSSETGKWQTPSGSTLGIEEIIAARCTVANV